MARKLTSRLRQEPTGPFEQLMELGQQLFFAGLGAAMKVVEEGTRLLGTQTEPSAAETGGKPPNWEELEQLFEDRVLRALNKLDVPMRSDFQALTARLDALEKKTEAFIDNAAEGARSAAEKS